MTRGWIRGLLLFGYFSIVAFIDFFLYSDYWRINRVKFLFSAWVASGINTLIARNHTTNLCNTFHKRTGTFLKPNKVCLSQLLYQLSSHNPFTITMYHDDVIKWKHFPRYWPFVRGIHRSPVNSPHKGQWRGALIFSWICARINGWVNNCEAGDMRRHRAHYNVLVMWEMHGIQIQKR